MTGNRFTLYVVQYARSQASIAEMVSFGARLDQAQEAGAVTPVSGASGEAILLYDNV